MRLDVDPSGPQARQWLLDELAKDDYHDGRSLFERVMRWIAEQIDRLQPQQPDAPGFSLPPLAVALVALALGAAIVWLLTRIRAVRGTVQQPEAVLGDSTLTATQLRDRGAAALRDGRYGEAVLHYTRAMARESADRTLLSDAPSLTAHEIGGQLAEVFPARAGDITGTTDLFDAVRYGRYAATRADAEGARDTADALRDTRPRLTDHLGPRGPLAAAGSPGQTESTTLSAFGDRS